MIYSYVARTVEEGGWSGVCRADETLRQVVPGLVSVSQLPALKPGDVVITDNHLATKVPADISTVVVHRGCAATHFERDPSWRNKTTQAMVTEQHAMFCQPNRVYVAPGKWVADEFRRHYNLGPRYRPFIVPNWVEIIQPDNKPALPVVIGDWRDWNKGAGHWRSIAALCPDVEFKQLKYDPASPQERRRIYSQASLYLCLSVSEGGPHSVADAEAARLPIVTTNVGNYQEFKDCMVMDWADRERPARVAAAVRHKLEVGRRLESFYHTFTLAECRTRWQQVITAARRSQEAVK